MNRAMDGLENVARTFAYEWKAHHAGRFEENTLFGRTMTQDWQFFLSCMGVSATAVQGSIVLDAGCGSGRFTRLIGEHSAKLAIGVDINEAVEDAFNYCRDLDNVHIVQANVFALPLRKRLCDLIWCSGVIHHTPDAREAHRRLSAFVRPGGVLYVWVYAKRFNPFRLAKSIVDAVRLSRLPESVLFVIAKILAYLSMGLLLLYRTARKIPGLRPRTAWGHRTVRRRTLRELHLTWFDALSPEYDSRHTEAEVMKWFQEQGFEQVTAIVEPKVGVRGTAPTSSIGHDGSSATENADPVE